MRSNPIGFALSLGMALIVVLFGFTLLSAGSLVGFAADDLATASAGPGEDISNDTTVSLTNVNVVRPALSAEEAAQVAAGDALFKAQCVQCHAVNEHVVGPALAGITKRRPVSWLIPWIKNSSKVVASGDEYAVALYNKYNKQQMPSFALSDKEITSIIAYVTAQEAEAIPTGGAVAAR
ncbi:MAG TPA: cytochrome c [Hymenobacter sp.]|jgi:mono/diheme cytochrome c family protein